MRKSSQRVILELLDSRGDSWTCALDLVGMSGSRLHRDSIYVFLLELETARCVRARRLDDCRLEYRITAAGRIVLRGNDL